MRKVYLAGPEVFLPDGESITEAKRALTRQYGFQPNIWSGDRDWPTDKFEIGVFIAKGNESVMSDSDFIIANMTPFRGISTDVGTAFEIGFMCAQGKPAFGYTNDGRLYGQRVTDDYYQDSVGPDEKGVNRAPDGQMVEDHSMSDNLMLDGGMHIRGGIVARPSSGVVLPWADLSIFEQALGAAQRFFAGLDP
jgi:nucleoside 2-deoxyribosyltransferase